VLGVHLASARGVGAYQERFPRRRGADEQQVEQAVVRVDGVDERGGESDRFLCGTFRAAAALMYGIAGDGEPPPC